MIKLEHSDEQAVELGFDYFSKELNRRYRWEQLQNFTRAAFATKYRGRLSERMIKALSDKPNNRLTPKGLFQLAGWTQSEFSDLTTNRSRSIVPRTRAYISPLMDDVRLVKESLPKLEVFFDFLEIASFSPDDLMFYAFFHTCSWARTSLTTASVNPFRLHSDLDCQHVWRKVDQLERCPRKNCDTELDEPEIPCRHPLVLETFIALMECYSIERQGVPVGKAGERIVKNTADRLSSMSIAAPVFVAVSTLDGLWEDWKECISLFARSPRGYRVFERTLHHKPSEWEPWMCPKVATNRRYFEQTVARG